MENSKLAVCIMHEEVVMKTLFVVVKEEEDVHDNPCVHRKFEDAGVALLPKQNIKSKLSYFIMLFSTKFIDDV